MQIAGQIPLQPVAAPQQAASLVQGSQALPGRSIKSQVKVVSPRTARTPSQPTALNSTIGAGTQAAAMQHLNTPQPALPTQSFVQVTQGPQTQAFQGAQAMHVIPALVPPAGQYAAPVVPIQLQFGGPGLPNLAGLVAGGVCYGNNSRYLY